MSAKKQDVEELVVQLVQGIYTNGQIHVGVDEGYSQEFEIKVGVLIIMHFPWAVCCIGVGNNSIYCNGCKHCVRNAKGFDA